MTQELVDYLQKIVDLSNQDKFDLGVDCIKTIFGIMHDKGYSDEDIAIFIVEITKLFVSANRECSEDEFNFFVDVTGWEELTFDEFYEITNEGAAKEFFDYVCGKLREIGDDEVVNNAITFGALVISCDDVIEEDELDLFDAVINSL